MINLSLTTIFIIISVLVLFITFSILYLKIYYIPGGTVNPKYLLPENNKNLKDKLVIITGCTSGIGLETAKELASLGCHLIMACRNPKKTEKAKKEIIEFCVKKNNIKPNIESKLVDLESLETVGSFVEYINKINKPLALLVNNGGLGSSENVKTLNGFEKVFNVNYLSHFYLTILLLPKIIKENKTKTRIVFVSSSAHEYLDSNLVFDNKGNNGKGLIKKELFDHWKSDGSIPKHFYNKKYELSKVAVNSFCVELSHYLIKNNINATTYSLHPGVVKTEIFQKTLGDKKLFLFILNLFKPIMKTCKQGAQTSLYCCLDPELNGVSGKYYADCKEKQQNKICLNREFTSQLWNWTMNELKNVVKIKPIVIKLDE